MADVDDSEWRTVTVKGRLSKVPLPDASTLPLSAVHVVASKVNVRSPTTTVPLPVPPLASVVDEEDVDDDVLSFEELELSSPQAASRNAAAASATRKRLRRGDRCIEIDRTQRPAHT